MENSESKKMYWMKLHTSFFDKHEIQILWNRNHDFVMLYIRLIIESIPYTGCLRFSSECSYTTDDIACLFGMDPTVVESGMKYLAKYKLIEVEKDGTIYIPFAHKCMIAQTQWADKKRRQRANEKLANGWRRLNHYLMTSPDGNRTINVNETECGGHGMYAVSKTDGKCSVCGSTHKITIIGGRGEETEPSDLRVLCSACAAAETTGAKIDVSPKLLTVKSIVKPPESFDEIISYLTDDEHLIVVNRPSLEAKFTELRNRGWKDRKNRLIRDWKSFFLGMATRHINKAVAAAKAPTSPSSK